MERKRGVVLFDNDNGAAVGGVWVCFISFFGDKTWCVAE